MKMRAETRRRRRESGLLDDVVRCSKCDAPNDRAPQRYCRACKRAYDSARWRKHALVPKETLTEEQRARIRKPVSHESIS